MNVVTATQRGADWIAARRGVPTCSSFDRILTAVLGKPSAAQDDFINDLIAESLVPSGEAPHMSADMEYGMRLEAEARCAYELGFASAPVKEVGFVMASCGLYGGSPDALVGDEGGVEIKCPNGPTHVSYLRGGVLPNGYKCQLHGYMIVTERNWWDFYSHCRGLPPFILRVMRDAFTTRLETELLAFCGRYNQARAKFNLPPLGLAALKAETTP